MRQKVINILQEIRPEFDFNQDIDFIEEGMLDSFDVVSLVTTLDENFRVSIDGMDIVSNIAEVPTNASDKPLTDVIMTKVEVVKYTAEELLTNFGFTIP